MFCARLFICAVWSPAGKGLTSWLSFVVSSVSLSLSHWYPGSGVVLDCIDSWSLQPYLLWNNAFQLETDPNSSSIVYIYMGLLWDNLEQQMSVPNTDLWSRSHCLKGHMNGLIVTFIFRFFFVIVEFAKINLGLISFPRMFTTRSCFHKIHRRSLLLNILQYSSFN